MIQAETVVRIHSTSHDQQQPQNSSAAAGSSLTSAGGSKEAEVDNSIDRIIDSQDNGVCGPDDHCESPSHDPFSAAQLLLHPKLLLHPTALSEPHLECCSN